MRLPDGEVDLATGVVTRTGVATVRLTTRERAVLAYLAARPGVDVSRDELLREVFGFSPSVLSRAADTTIARLRGKIERAPDAPCVLITAHGAGHRLVPAEREGVAVDEPHATVLLSPRARRVLAIDGIAVDLDTGEARARDGATLARLTRQELRVLAVLGAHRGDNVDGARLAREVLGRAGSVRALAVAVSRLRGKLRNPASLVASRGSGYCLREEAVRVRDLRGATEVLWSIADSVSELLGFEDCVVYAREGDALVQRAAAGPKRAPDRSVIDPIAIPIGTGVVGAAALCAEPQLVHDTRSDPRYIRDGFAGRSEVAVPIVLAGHVVGVIDSEAARPAAYTESDAARLGSLARLVQAAMADGGAGFTPGGEGAAEAATELTGTGRALPRR